MHDKILQYLLRTGHPVSSQDLLRDVLHVRSPDPRTADEVFLGFLKNDARFRRLDSGLWTVSENVARAGDAPEQTAILFIRVATAHPVRVQGAVLDPDTGGTLEFSVTGSPPRDTSKLAEALQQAAGRILVCWSRDQIGTWKKLLRSAGLGAWTGKTVCLRTLSRRILTGIARGGRAEDLAPLLDLPPPDLGDPGRMAGFLASCYRELIARLPSARTGSYESLQEWMAHDPGRMSFDRFGFDETFLRSLPEAPGVYVMRNRAGELFYVGKARNLRRRVRSYFTPSARKSKKTSSIHRRLHTIEICPSPSEVEALILEVRMIRDFRPFLNLQTEVHERPSTYAKSRNVVLLVPDHAGEGTHIYLIKDGRFRGRATGVLSRSPSHALLKRIRTLFFTRPAKTQGSPTAWESELVTSWLAANRRRLNFVDIDEAGSFESVRRQLESYLKDRDLLSGKILHL